MSTKHKSFWMTPPGWAAIGLIAAASYFLYVEHQEHIFELLPYLILIACPFMHIFMHRRHNHKQMPPDDQASRFKEVTKESDAYREGFIEGLKKAKDESSKKKGE